MTELLRSGLTSDELFEWLSDSRQNKLFRRNTEFEPFNPMEEGHHSDGVHKGPADIFIIRHGHEQIHSDVADACRLLGEKTKGFYGDPTTLKLGNKFFGTEDETPDYLKTYKIPEFDLSTFHVKKEKTISERWAEVTKNMNLIMNNSNTEEETPSYLNFGINKPKIFNARGEEETPIIDFTTNYLKTFGIKQEDDTEISMPWLNNNINTPIYRSNQENWLGGRNNFALPNALSVDVNAHYSPVLTPLFAREDNYIVSNNLGNDIYNATLARETAKTLAFERSNVGIADYENNIYKRDMIPVGRLSDSPSSFRTIDFGTCTYKSAWK